MAETRNFNFKGFSFSFINWAGEWVIPGKILGKALGYSDDGDKLNNLIGGSWKKSFNTTTSSETVLTQSLPDIDAVMVTGEALANFKAISEMQSYNAPQLLVLTLSGLIKVLTKSRSKASTDFRNYLATAAKDWIGPASLPTKRVGSGNPRKDKALAIPAAQKSAVLDDLLKVLGEMRKLSLLTKAEQKELYGKVAEIQFTRFSKEAGVTHFLNPDGTVSLTKTSAMSKNALAVPEGNFNVVTRDNKYHPAYPGWLPAQEIGRPFGLKADLVKKYCKNYCLSKASDLPNNDAKKFVEMNGGKFPDLDEHGFIIYKPAHGFGIALLSKMEGNSLNWRNYWSPEAVIAIRESIAKDRGFAQTAPDTATPVQLNLTPSVPAPNHLPALKSPEVVEGVVTQATNRA